MPAKHGYLNVGCRSAYTRGHDRVTGSDRSYFANVSHRCYGLVARGPGQHHSVHRAFAIIQRHRDEVEVLANVQCELPRTQAEMIDRGGPIGSARILLPAAFRV